jgi:hypothetical protein
VRTQGVLHGGVSNTPSPRDVARVYSGTAPKTSWVVLASAVCRDRVLPNQAPTAGRESCS